MQSFAAAREGEHVIHSPSPALRDGRGSLQPQVPEILSKLLLRRG